MKNLFITLVLFFSIILFVKCEKEECLSVPYPKENALSITHLIDKKGCEISIYIYFDEWEMYKNSGTCTDWNKIDSKSLDELAELNDEYNLNLFDHE